MNILDDNDKARGIDYDLAACLAYNPQKFTTDDIIKVLAVWEGEREVEDWRWIIELTYGFIFLQGWCDYTGWDCQSGARSVLETSVERAVAQAILTHTTFDGLTTTIIADLLYQVLHGKGKTWREKKDEEFGL